VPSPCLFLGTPYPLVSEALYSSAMSAARLGSTYTTMLRGQVMTILM
jgi:hypothetical protein